MSADLEPRTPAPPHLVPEPNPLRFRDATALVIGAGHGIGAACAARLAAEGASVVGADLDQEAVHGTIADLPVIDGAVHHALPVDVRDDQSVRAAVGRCVELAGGLDVLAHVAGGTLVHDDLEAADEEVWRQIVDWNLLGAARSTRAAIQPLRRSRRGAIVTVASVNGIFPLGDAPYGAAKAGLISLTGDLAAHLAPEGIRVNAIAPGTVRTRVWDGSGADSRRSWYPLGRVGEPADIAAALAFLASREAAWITGQVLAVDGGLLLRRTGPGID